jgi:hypothetical protein
MTRPPLARFDDVIVDQHPQCRQEGVQVCSHKRSRIPSSHLPINPTRRTGPGWESLIQIARSAARATWRKTARQDGDAQNW